MLLKHNNETCQNNIHLRQATFVLGPPSLKLRRDSSEALAKENFGGLPAEAEDKSSSAKAGKHPRSIRDINYVQSS